MNVSEYTKNLSAQARQRIEQAALCDNVSLAASILVSEGFIDSALKLCLETNYQDEAIDIAINTKQYESAISICQSLNRKEKVAEIYTLQGELDKAAETLVSIQKYDQAAKLYFNTKQYDKAADLYEKNDQYMNAVMCYQKSGNAEKQLEMQIKAFDHDLAIANGDMQAVTVSRTMAIYAAKTYLENDLTRAKGLETLNKADALEDTANELFNNGKYLLAGYCLQFDQKLPKALEAFIMANAADPALEICKILNDKALEIDTLRRLRKFYLLGQELATPNTYADAIVALKNVDSDDPDYVNAVELQGDIYCKQKKYNDAVLCYESLFLQMIPSDRLCRIAFKAGYCYESNSDFHNALKTYQKVYDINPTFHDINAVIDSVAQKLRAQSKAQSVPNEGTDHNSAILRRPASRSRKQSIMIGDTEIPTNTSSRYKIIEEVAHGGMGVVYKATDTILMRTVALKVLSQKLKDNQVALEYFMREARASAKLQHINIVSVYDIGSLEDGNIYMAMEYVEGKNLKQLVQQTGKFPLKFLIQVAIHACRGLQYAHENGIIHRDIKSSNMMIAKRDKTLKILDLGLAKVISEHERNSTQAIGTPYYMSPEQVLGNEIDARSDIYSLGVTLFELATGVLPFIKGDLPYKHVHEPPPLPSSITPDINPQIEDLILKMMQKCPDDRFSSCNEILAYLKRINARGFDD